MGAVPHYTHCWGGVLFRPTGGWLGERFTGWNRKYLTIFFGRGEGFLFCWMFCYWGLSWMVLVWFLERGGGFDLTMGWDGISKKGGGNIWSREEKIRFIYRC